MSNNHKLRVGELARDIGATMLALVDDWARSVVVDALAQARASSTSCRECAHLLCLISDLEDQGRRAAETEELARGLLAERDARIAQLEAEVHGDRDLVIASLEQQLEAARAFHDVAVRERDFERVRCARLADKLDALTSATERDLSSAMDRSPLAALLRVAEAAGVEVPPAQTLDVSALGERLVEAWRCQRRQLATSDEIIELGRRRHEEALAEAHHALRPETWPEWASREVVHYSPDRWSSVDDAIEYLLYDADDHEDEWRRDPAARVKIAYLCIPRTSRDVRGDVDNLVEGMVERGLEVCDDIESGPYEARLKEALRPALDAALGDDVVFSEATATLIYLTAGELLAMVEEVAP